MQPSPQANPNLLVKAGCSGLFGVKFWKWLRMNIPQPLYGTCSRAEKFSRWRLFSSLLPEIFFVANYHQLQSKTWWTSITMMVNCCLTWNSFSTRTPGPIFSWRYALQPVVPSICEYRRSLFCWTWKHMIHSFLTDFKISRCHLPM